MAPVICASCGHENRAGAKFCRKCGVALGDGDAPAEREPRDYTPRHLVDKILNTKSAIDSMRCARPTVCPCAV